MRNQPRVQAPPRSPPRWCLLEDLAQCVMRMEERLEQVKHADAVLGGLQCWGPDIADVPEQQALLQRVERARQALPLVKEVVRQQVCEPLRQDLLPLARYVGNPSWRLFERAQEGEMEEEGDVL